MGGFGVAEGPGGGKVIVTGGIGVAGAGVAYRVGVTVGVSPAKKAGSAPVPCVSATAVMVSTAEVEAACGFNISFFVPVD